MSRVTTVAATAALLLTAACSGPMGGSSPDPEEAVLVVEAFVEAILGGDGTAACEQMTEDFQREVLAMAAALDVDDCESLYEVAAKMTAEEREENFGYEATLVGDSAEAAEVSVDYEHEGSNDETYTLVPEGGSWLIDDSREN